MTNAYFLNGCATDIDLVVNNGPKHPLDKLDLQTPTRNQTVRLGLAVSPAADQIGLGLNEVRVTVDGVTTIYRVELSSAVILSLDVQFLIFANALEAKNTIGTDGFKITVVSKQESEAARVASEAAPPAPAPGRRPPAIVADEQDISFTKSGEDDKGAVYAASNNDAGAGSGGDTVALTYFYLFATGTPPPDTLTLDESFAAAGAYVFSDEAVDAGILLDELGRVLSDAGTFFSRIAWRMAANDYTVLEGSSASAVSADIALPIGSWQVFLRRNTRLSLNNGAPAIRFTPATAEDSIEVRVVRSGLPQAEGTKPDEILLPLVGAHRGALTFAWDWSHYALETGFGGNLRLFFGSAPETAGMAQYRLFTPAPDPGRFDTPNLFFNTYVQPLAPLDDRRTRLALDLSQQNALTSTYVTSTTNAAVRLVPAAQPLGQSLTAGFGFARNPDSQSTSRYLCPVGEFEVSGLALDRSLSAAAAPADRIQIRGGLSGTEYVLVKPGDRLSFESGRPAFARNYDPAGGGPATLDDALTTAWVRAVRDPMAGPANGDAAEELINTSYCAQSPASTYFGKDLSGTEDYDFPIAVGASLVQFDDAPPASAPPVEEEIFPMMPYGGVYFAAPDEGIPDPNPDLSSQDLEAIERQVIARNRRARLAPYFDMKYGPIFFDTSTNAAFDGGYARTPLGLLAKLNPVTAGAPPAGSIQRLILARSPQIPEQFAALNPNGDGVVNPVFSNAVLDENLFLVASDAQALAPFEDKIKLGDFTFDLALGNAPDEAVAIFKFVPGVTLNSLIDDTETWTALTGEASEDSVQARLKSYIATAHEGGEIFAPFLALLDDPDWNGIIFFNAPLDYQALPLDIQILLGGISGKLSAHHFGITINRVGDLSANPEIERSSLFSVIHYQEDFVGPDENPSFKYPDFQVLLLNVHYANSKLATFDSKIAFSIDTLFGSKAKLKVAPDTDDKDSGTIVIDGVYTLYEDGTGSLIFSTQAPRSFVFDPDDKGTVLTAQSITDATLVPITRTPGSGECVTLALSGFRIGGLLAFRDDIGGDIFSYGEVADDMPVKGLAITGYSFAMTTCIRKDNTAALQGAILTDLSSLKVDQLLSKARAQSLERTLPGKIVALDETPAGLKPAAIGEWQVRISGASFKGAPVYSLQFDIPLGLFGALAAFNTNLTATLFIGWNPAETDPEKNVGVILRFPPEISGPKGFNFEGILTSSFEYVQIDRLALSEETVVSVLRMVHYQGQLLNLFFNYNIGPKDLGIFGFPGDPGGSNSLFFVGKSADTNWNGPKVTFALDGAPVAFLLRAYEVKTDPTNPNVINEVFDKLNPFSEKTVAEFVSLINANRSLYNSDAGLAFGIKFAFKSLALTAVLHDNTFYGAQIKLTPEKKDKPDDDKPDGGTKPPAATPSIREIVEAAPLSLRLPATDEDGGDKEDKDNGFLSKVQDFTFTIIYRKVSDEVGVFSADIYLNLGQINVGAFQLSLPNFSISIWTNGDWRFAIGWPFNGDSATPITVQFQAGPVPVIAKAGFYLAKLSSAAAPDQFGPEFGLIWSFGVGIAGGVGKEFKEGPLKAGASLILGLTVEGFLASFDGTFTSNGVDYWWWGISLSLTGNVFGKVDFEIIAVEVSLTVTITVAFAIETKHKTPLKLTAEVKAKASIKIVFVKISFSFQVTLNLINTEFGSGSATAKLSGPTPTAVSIEAFERNAELTRRAMIALGAAPGRLRTPAPLATRSLAATAAAPLPLLFALQPTSVSQDGTTWVPQGVATLVMETGGTGSPFGQMCAGLARWLLNNLGSGDNFHERLISTSVALEEGQFQTRVAEALSQSFIFQIAGGAPGEDGPAFVTFPMPASLSVVYGDADPRMSLGSRFLPRNYRELVARYFAGESAANLSAEQGVGEETIIAMLFDEFFVMLAQQLVQQMVETGAPDLETALAELNISDLGGFVSRFLMGGLRLPDPAEPGTLRALYVLTGQQFPLQRNEDGWLLSAGLSATASTPDWIEVAADTTSALTADMVHTTGPAAAPWQVTQLAPLTVGPQIYAMNNITSWSDASGTSQIINSLPEALLQAVREAAPGTLYLSQHLAGGESDADQQVNLGKPGAPWEASAALALPVRLAAIPDPQGAPGAILPDVYSLLGTDEANRALLQALLDDEAVDLVAVDLVTSAERGNWVSTQVPSVLVRADLSTASSPAGAAIEAMAASANGPNYAKLAEGGAELRAFLRLLWEVSVVHSAGFFLQVDGLEPEIFAEGPANLMVLVRFGASSGTIATKPYQNVLVGPAPDAGKAIFSTLASDAQGTPVPSYSATYAGGSVGWSISWPDAPVEADAAGTDFLRALYQLVSYRVTAINGMPATQNWSRPVTATDTGADGGGQSIWTYQSVFATAPLVDAENRYAAVGDTLTVQLSVEDVFGNTLPTPLSPTVELDVVFNDDLLGLGNWTGTEASYLVTGGEQAPNLGLNLTFDPGIILDTDGNSDPEILKTVTALYAQVADQLGEAGAAGRRVAAHLDTHDILASRALDTTIDGTSLVAGLEAYVTDVLGWLAGGGTGTPPAGHTITFALTRDQPTRWPGDLQELRVDLVLERSGVPDEIAAHAPQVRRSAAPVQPVEETADASDDPSGLTTFADKFETAYFPFDGKAGTVKVATGTNSDLTSLRFGQRSIWLQRWGKDAGTEVRILNDEDNAPVFFAPPPLSTQLITREVAGLRRYTSPSEFETVDVVFNNTDMDLWAARFLRTVETIFSPTMAPNVADNASPADELYDPFVASKESLAGTLSEKIDYVYEEPEDTGDPVSARETWRQALLRSLENDYGFSTLTQLAAMVHLNGPIEPGGDTRYPPQLFGAVQVPGVPQNDKLPYALTPAVLPLVEGKNWLNFLTSAQDPEAQRAFTLDLNYEVNQMEHLRDGSASDRGYVPSNWLTFVLQQNPAPLPQGQDNTLTQPIGTTRIPIPLRTYPPLPKLQTVKARQADDISVIADALTWTAAVTVERSRADQDTLNLSLSFNEPLEEGGSDMLLESIADAGREPPTDLFAALARFVTEYPQLQPFIDDLGRQGPPASVEAVKAFSRIIGDAAALWPAWSQPKAANGGIEAVRRLTRSAGDGPVAREVWNFEIQNQEGSETHNLQVRASWSRSDGLPPWPDIAGYARVSVDGDTAIYKPEDGAPHVEVAASWSGLFVLDYQSMRPSAYTTRNQNLAVPPASTNPDFVYRTETITWPTPVVPLITAAKPIVLGPPDTPDTSAEAAIQSMLTQLDTAPAGSIRNGSGNVLEYESPIDYRYEVIANADSSAVTNLPVLLVTDTVPVGDEQTAAARIAANLRTWREKTGASSKSSSLMFRLTVFATTIAQSEDRLPLVQFQGLVIPAKNDPAWW